MPIRSTPEPFAPGTPPDRDTLLAYAEGRLDDAQQHAVEQHLEADPMLREAMEGMTMPGAMGALPKLDRMRPYTKPWAPWTLAGMLVIVAGAWLILSPILERQEPAMTILPEQPVVADDPIELNIPLEVTEIDAAVEQPESLRIGHLTSDRHIQQAASATSVEREPVPERIIGGSMPKDLGKPPAPPIPEKGPRTVTRLIYLQGFKLAHPDDLRYKDPHNVGPGGSVRARFEDRHAQDAAEDPHRTMGYVPFMDRALTRFKRNDHKGTLEELRHLMEQFPDDVNALFYAGLCCYNLGMYQHARALLHRAATHAVPVFDEEAAWYHALTLERLGEHTAAQEAFGRIAAQGGFYAAQARTMAR